ncbi:MAG: hypothetical protein WAN16_11425 [Chthoniobacterales bacterium]
MNPTDTPRTDAAISLKQNYELSEKDCPVYENYVHAEVCAEIERELSVTKKLLDATRKDVGKGLELADEWAAKCVKAESNHAVLWEAVKQEQDLRKKLRAEVESLKKELSDWDYGTRAKREQERAERAESEVERLRAYLLTALNISTWTLGNSISNDQFQQFQAEIRRIKDFINYPDYK